MPDRNLQLALRIRAAVQGADNIEDLRRDLGGLADEIENADGPARDLNDGLNDLNESGRKAGGGIKAAADPMAEFKSLIADIAVAALAKQILDLNDQMTALKRGFDVIFGSTEKTGEALAFVRGVADKLGVGVNDLAQSYLKLTAASKGTQLEGAATEQIFASLAGAMSVVGAGAQEVDQAMTALAQIMSKGVVSAEELRGQLGDVLPGAAQQAANALLVTNAEFSKMLESGEIVASEFLPKFAAQLEKAMGAGKGQVQGFGAAWSRLTNQLIDLATGPVGTGFTAFVAGLTEKLGLLARGAGFLSDAIGAVGTALGGIAAGEPSAALEDLGQSAENAALKLFGIKTASEQAAENQKQMQAELKALVPEMDRFQNAIGRRELKDLPEYLQAAVAEFRKTGDAAAATEQAISKFLSGAAQNLNFDGVVNLAGALQAVGQEAKGAGATIQDTLAAALEKLTDEQLIKLKEQAEAAMAAASQGSETARKAFADLGLVVDAVANVQLKRAADAAQRVADSTNSYSGALGQLANAQLDGLRTEIDLAKAKGQTWVAQQKSVELAELEAKWAQTLAVAKQLEIQASQKATEAKIAELQARAEQNAATQLEIASLQIKLQALGKEAEAQKLLADLAQVNATGQQKQGGQIDRATDAVERNTAAVENNAAAAEKQAQSYTLMEDAATGALRELSGLSKGMNDLLSASLGLQDIGKLFGSEWTGELGRLKLQLDQTLGAIQHNTRNAGILAGAFLDNANAANATRKSYLEQAIAAESLGAELTALTDSTDSNAQNLADMVAQAQAAKTGFGLLDDERLENLQRAIDGANDRIREMQGLTRDARDQLAELNAEIAAEKGDTATADRLKLRLDQTRALADAEQKILDAQAAGNTELIALYEEQKRKLDELYQLKEKNLESDIKQRNNQNAPATTGGHTTGNTSGQTATSQPSGNGAGGITVNNTFLIDPTKLTSESWIRQYVLPPIDNIKRRKA